MKSLSQVTVASAYHWVAQADIAQLRTVPTATATVAVPRMRPRNAIVLGTCCMSLFLTGLDNTAVNVGLPAIGAQLHAPVAGLQWVVAAYTVVLASLLMLAGTLADRFGRKAVFQVGLCLFTLGSWLCSLAPGLAWLVAFRVLQGAGASMLNPAALGIIANTFTRPAERARAVGVWDAVFGLSMALGPVAGGVLAETAGWRGIFWANIPVGLAAICLTAVFVPDSRARKPRRTDPPGQALVILVLAALALAIIEGPALGWASPLVTGAASVSAVALVLLLACELRRAEPLIDVRMFRDARFAALSLTAVLVTALLAGWLFLTTLYLQDVRGESAARAGLTILPMPVAMAACAALAGRVLARRGPRVPLAVAGCALAASCAVLSRLSGSTGPVFLLVTYSLFGAGFGLASASVTNGIMSAVPKSRASVASGINSASRQLGMSLGVAVAGSVLASSLRGSIDAGFLHAAPASWLVLAGCGAAVLRLSLAIAARRRRPARPAAVPALAEGAKTR
jgi:EmrB/QacA subfamily drug resistance transporter